MGRRAPIALIGLAAAAALAEPAVADADRLAEFAPVVRYDRDERLHATSVEAALGQPGVRLVGADGETLAGGDGLPLAALGPGRAARGQHLTLPAADPRGPDVAYGRSARGADGRVRLQYWLFYVDNPQDRGVLRTGRHAGDWELVQITLDRRGRPSAVTAAQHSWAERCGWSQTRRSGSRVEVFPANGSHATYLQPGDVHRPLGDPVDHAGGTGRRARLAVREITATRPGWMRWQGRWGGATSGIVPAEQPSPRGPAWQGLAWDDPAAFERGARPCGSGPPGRPVVTGGLLVLVIIAAFGIGTAVRRTVRRRAS